MYNNSIFSRIPKMYGFEIVFFSSQNIDRDWKYIQPTAYISQTDSRKVKCALIPKYIKIINQFEGFFSSTRTPFP